MAKYFNCGNKVDENAYICPKCGIVVETKNNNNVSSNVNNIVEVDNGGIGWAFLGFFFPIVGLILYLSWKDNKPKTAKAAGKGALISTIVGIGIYVLMMILFGIIFVVMTSAM